MTASTFLATAAAAHRLLAHPSVPAHWTQPSALEGYTVGGLAAHLARAVLTVASYLDAPAPAPDVEVTDAAGYLVAVLGDHDPLDSELHRGVRARADQLAADGPHALAEAVAAAVATLEQRLPVEPGDRLLTVFDDLVLPLDDYLATRLVELVVHLDDLAFSVGLPASVQLPGEAYEEVARVLITVAVRRGDPLHVVRSLARRERHPDPIHAL